VFFSFVVFFTGKAHLSTVCVSDFSQCAVEILLPRSDLVFFFDVRYNLSRKSYFVPFTSGPPSLQIQVMLDIFFSFLVVLRPTTSESWVVEHFS